MHTRTAAALTGPPRGALRQCESESNVADHHESQQ